MNLTDWWLAFASDLDSLAHKIPNSQSAAWRAARTMIAEGVQIEANFLWGLSYAAKINEAARSLGEPFHNPATGQLMHLPEVKSADSLLFALIYREHLERYALINQGNELVLSQLIKEQSGVGCAAAEMKRRIDLYCANKEYVGEFKVAYPDAITSLDMDFLGQVQQWLAEKSVVEKLISQLEGAAAEMIAEYDISLKNVMALFSKVESFLSRKIALLKSISAYKKLIELLSEGLLLPEDLAEPESLKHHYPYFADAWLDLDADTPRLSKQDAIIVQGARGVSGATRFAAGVVSSFVHKTLGRIVPQFIGNLFAKTAKTLDVIASGITPVSITEQRKQALIKQANKYIAMKVSALNSKHDMQINANDFKNMSSKDVADLADKVSLLQSMVTFKKCLLIYQQEHTIGITKFSLFALLKPITELLCRTFMRRVIFSGVLLVLEAEKLESEVGLLIQQTKAKTEFDKTALKLQIISTLEHTKKRTSKFLEENRFAFFKQQGRLAADKFQEVVAEASTVLYSGL